MNSQTFEQSIWIDASVSLVDRVITDQVLMHQWLNPALQCQPVGQWRSDVGAQSIFLIRIPLVRLRLHSTIVERRQGLVVWEFTGFFEGRDRWECVAHNSGTLLQNQFTFQASSPMIRWGFEVFAARLTKRDMEHQLQRLKRVAEQLNQSAP